MSSLDDALAVTLLDGVPHGRVTPAWTQGRTAFGGILAGLACRVLRDRVSPERRLRSVLVDFVSPAEVGPVRVDVTVLREGRALTHAEARLVQGEDVRAVAVLVYAVDRATAIRWAAAPPAEVPAPDALAPFPYVEGVTPRFTQCFDYRWTTGAGPFTGGAAAVVGGWVRARVPVDPDEAVVLALLDAWPAPVLPLLKEPAPASTVTWMVDLVGPVDAPPAAWWRFEGAAVAAGDGLASVEGRLWHAGGLVAVSRQLVAEFSRG